MKISAAKEILVVEDEPSISDICRRVLTGEGFNVDIASNGKLAQGMIEKKSYDLCLIDIKTPKLNGKELYQWLEEKHPQVTDGVVFSTGDVLDGDTQYFLEHTGRPFLSKPFTPNELKAVMNKALKEIKK